MVWLQLTCMHAPAELCFSSPPQLIEPIKIFELRCQMKNKNTVLMEKKLTEQKGMLQNLQVRTC